VSAFVGLAISRLRHRGPQAASEPEAIDTPDRRSSGTDRRSSGTA